MRLLPQAKVKLKEAIDKALTDHAGHLVNVMMRDYGSGTYDIGRFRKGIDNLIKAHAELHNLIDTWGNEKPT